jgi:hypothetical protein
VLVKEADRIWHRIEENVPSQDRAGQFTEAGRGDLDGDRRTSQPGSHVILAAVSILVAIQERA